MFSFSRTKISQRARSFITITAQIIGNRATLLAIFSFPWFLAASVQSPCHIDLFTGYRNDTIHWHWSEKDLFLNDRYRSVQFWQNGFSLSGIERDLYYFLFGSYSAFGRGELNDLLPTTGWAVDGDGRLGYAVNLTPDRYYTVLLIPIVEFSGYYEHIGTPNNFTLSWYGPAIGGAFHIEPGNRLWFDIGYTYHWLHLHAETNTPSPPDFSNRLTTSGWGNFGHSGWGSMEYVIDADWRVGGVGLIEYFFSGNKPVEDEQTTPSGNVDLTGVFKLRWTSFSGMITLSRRL